MKPAFDEQVRQLAEPLWVSANRPYGMALDYWLMAEQMIREMVIFTANAQKEAITDPAFSPWQQWLPEPAPVVPIRQLAECMWEAAGHQYGQAFDCWLAAERHVLAMMRAAGAGPSADEASKAAQELAALPPQAYLERIQMMAYYMWETAGRQYGQTLHYWLLAEQQLLSMMAAAAKAAPTARTDSPLALAVD